MDIQTQWSINDLADAHEMIEWKNAGIQAAKDKAARDRAATEANRRPR